MQKYSEATKCTVVYSAHGLCCKLLIHSYAIVGGGALKSYVKNIHIRLYMLWTASVARALASLCAECGTQHRRAMQSGNILPPRP